MILINSSQKNTLKMFQPFLPISVPLGIGFLFSVAEREGIKARFIDEQVEDNMLGLVAQYVKEIQKPYIFGFSVLTVAFKNAIVFSRKIKKLYPDSVIIFGGIHPTAMPDEVLSYDHIDFVMRGESEKTLIDFYHFIKNNEDCSHLENLSYRKNGKLIHNRRAPIVDDLDTLPSFPYHVFTSKYYDLGFVVSSRGCPYDCIFCSNRIITGKKYRFNSASVILEDLTLLYKKYNKNKIIFFDDNLLVNKERVYLLLEGIRKRGFDKKITFGFQARGDNADPKLLKEMYDCGFKSIFFGLETSSDKIMKVLKKNESVSECMDAVRIAKKIGFHVSATFIYGLPEETFADRMNCVKLSNELNLDMVRYNNATPYPGTELYNIAKEKGRLRIDGLYENLIAVGTFTENPFKKMPLAYVPEGNNQEEIRRDILFSYFNFYLHISRIKAIFFDPDVGVGWFSPGDSAIDVLKKTPAIITLFFMLFCKLLQLFYYSVIRKDTAISFRYFLKVFSGRNILKQKE